MEQQHRQFCTKCGNGIKNDAQKFCVKCGTQLIRSNDAVEPSPQNENWLKRIFTKDPVTFWVCVVATAVFLPPMIMSVFERQNNKPQVQIAVQAINKQQPKPSTSNPEYLKQPDQYIVDSKRIISDLPENGIAVWVEEVLDENTLTISHIVEKGGERFLTFQDVDLAGLRDFDNERVHCVEPLLKGLTPRFFNGRKEEARSQAIQYLKKLIEHKYVFLIVPEKDKQKECYLPRGIAFNLGKPKAEGIERFAMLPREEMDGDMSTTTSESIEVSLMMIEDGFGKYNYNGECYEGIFAQEVKDMKEAQEISHAAGRGFWKLCEDPLMKNQTNE